MLTGIVKDTTGKPLPAVGVTVKGESNASAITDMKGEFSLQVKKDKVRLLFSSIGFQTKEVVVTKETEIKVELTPGTSTLEEVVVIGYGTQRKRDVSGAISTINTKQIAERQAVDVFDAMQGQAPGIQVAQESGRPGAGSSVRIRGTATFEGGADPLYVVDGVQGVSIDGINPADIESIEILRDAASAAIYGSRSANGVIIVTTRKGKDGKAKVDLHTTNSLGLLAHKLPQATARERRMLEQKRLDISNVGGSINLIDSLNPSTNADNDYQEMIVRTGVRNQVDMSVAGGGKSSNYFGSIGYLEDNGILKNSWSKIARTRFNIDYKPSDKVAFATRVLGSYRTENRVNDGEILVGALARPAYVRIYLPDGTFASRSGSGGSINPVAQLLLEKNSYDIYNLGLSNSVAYTFNRNLKVAVETNLTGDYTNNNDFSPKILSTANPPINQLTDSKTLKTYWQVQSYLTYNKVFNSDHSMNFVLGVSADQNYLQGTIVSGTNLVTEDKLIIDAATRKYQPTNQLSRDYSNSAFGRVAYSYKGRYLLNSTVRRDASSKFGPNNRTGYFQSISMAWRLSDEKFMDWAKGFLDDGKFRISYGKTGNDKIGAYDQYTQYDLGNSYYNGISGVSTLPALGNPNLSWEVTSQFNTGYDLAMFRGRLTLTVDYYDKTTDKLLYTAPKPSSSGYSSVKVNVGSVSNRGLEFLIGGFPIKNKTFSWNVSFNTSYNFNRVLKLYNGTDMLPGNPNIWKVTERGHIGDFYGYKSLGVYSYDESNAYDPDWNQLSPVFDANGNFTGYQQNGKAYNGQVQRLYVNGVPLKGGDMIWQNTQKDSVIDDKDRVILGNAIPKFTAGFSNLFTYKQFTFSFNMYLSIGNTIYNDLRQSLNASITTNTTPEPDYIYNSWGKQGDVAKYPSPKINTGLDNGRDGSSLYMEDASFVRLRNVKLSYQLKSKHIARLKVGTMSMFVFGNNLITWTKYSGYDPEISFQSVLTAGFDPGRYPRKREFGMGLNVSF